MTHLTPSAAGRSRRALALSALVAALLGTMAPLVAPAAAIAPHSAAAHAVA